LGVIPVAAGAPLREKGFLSTLKFFSSTTYFRMLIFRD
jgi:hypothetical protein